MVASEQLHDVGSLQHKRLVGKHIHTHSGNNALEQNKWCDMSETFIGRINRPADATDNIKKPAFGAIFDADEDSRACPAKQTDLQSTRIRGHAARLEQRVYAAIVQTAVSL